MWNPKKLKYTVTFGNNIWYKTENATDNHVKKHKINNNSKNGTRFKVKKVSQCYPP